MTNYEILQKARLAILKEGRSGFLLKPEDYSEIGRAWAWRIVYNAEEHLAGRGPSTRSDLGIFFGESVAKGIL